MRVLKVQQSVSEVRDLPRAARNDDQRDEGWLIEKAKSGDEDAFGELYKRHHLRAYRAALRILRNQQDAEDAVQRAFQRALVNLERFREDSTFSTWLTRIVINDALMLLRRRRTRKPLLENGVDVEQANGCTDVADVRPTPEEIVCENERRATLLHAIGQLQETLKVIVLHRELQGLTSAETGQLLGLTISAVKARTFRARKLLRRHLERKFVGAELLARPQERKA